MAASSASVDGELPRGLRFGLVPAYKHRQVAYGPVGAAGGRLALKRLTGRSSPAADRSLACAEAPSRCRPELPRGLPALRHRRVLSGWARFKPVRATPRPRSRRHDRPAFGSSQVPPRHPGLAGEHHHCEFRMHALWHARTDHPRARGSRTVGAPAARYSQRSARVRAPAVPLPRPVHTNLAVAARPLVRIATVSTGAAVVAG